MLRLAAEMVEMVEVTLLLAVAMLAPTPDSTPPVPLAAVPLPATLASAWTPV